MEPILEGYIDANMANNLDSRKFKLGYVFNFVKEVVSWQFDLKKCIGLYTIEANYIVIAKVGKEILWLFHSWEWSRVGLWSFVIVKVL